LIFEHYLNVSRILFRQEMLRTVNVSRLPPFHDVDLSVNAPARSRIESIYEFWNTVDLLLSSDDGLPEAWGGSLKLRKRVAFVYHVDKKGLQLLFSGALRIFDCEGEPEEVHVRSGDDWGPGRGRQGELQVFKVSSSLALPFASPFLTWRISDRVFLSTHCLILLLLLLLALVYPTSLRYKEHQKLDWKRHRPSCIRPSWP
jgi:hypothetical protein